MTDSESTPSLLPLTSTEDRRDVARRVPAKDSKWPRTDRRAERIRSVLSRRQPDLTIVLEHVHDLHNISAVMRTCDAVGVMRVHLVNPESEAARLAFARTISAGSAKWIEWTVHDSITECYSALHRNDFTILATALRPGGIGLFDVDFTQPTALVFGNEMDGLSDEAINLADQSIQIPMVGMVGSLNISVACAVSLYEAFRQRRQAGFHDRLNLEPAEFDALEQEWLQK